MVKSELINAMSEKTGFKKSDVSKALDAFIESVEETLQQGEDVKISSFGNFKVRETNERNSRNPKTGEAIVVPAGRKPVFIVSKKLKELIKG